MSKDIRWRTAIPYTLLIIIVLGGLAIYLSRLVRDTQLADLEEKLTVRAKAIAENVGSDLANLDGDLNDAAARWAGLMGTRVTIIAPDGTVLGESEFDRAGMDNHLDRPEIQEAQEAGQGSSIRYSGTLQQEMMYAAVRVLGDSAGGKVLGFVRVALPLSQVEGSVRQLQQAILIAILITMVSASLIAIIIAGRSASSVHKLTGVARRVAEGDLDARLHLSSRDDLYELAHNFNYMADQLRLQVHNLDEERERLLAVLENMADGVLITDDMGRVSLINPAAARLLDVDEGESIGQSFAVVARHHELIESWQEGCEASQERTVAVELERQGNFIQMIVTPLGATDQLSCLVILQDLTRIRRLETVRRDFISNISHELRTPLASLKALVETLRDTALDDPPAAKRFLDQADQEVDALAQMVRELLELSRIESGKVPFRFAPVPVEKVILPPVERLKPQAKRQKLTLRVEIDDDLPLLMVDADRIQQVTGNLVHNAIKFTPEGGTITVQARLDKNKPLVVISVADSGVGIPPAELDRIFERFYKADRARSGGGTGLGLAIARHLVQTHGGEIWARSKEGKGSTFTFSLPVAGSEDEHG